MPLQIDKSRPLGIYGSITRDLSKMPQHPMHDIAMKFAREEGNPAFLRMAVPVAEANLEIPAMGFLQWLDESWLTGEFLRELQGLAQTWEGEPLLTSWVSWGRFWAVVSGAEGPVAEALRLHVQGWREMGLDEVYFDFYAKPA